MITKKEREVISGQLNAACIIIRETHMELMQIYHREYDKLSEGDLKEMADIVNISRNLTMILRQSLRKVGGS